MTSYVDIDLEQHWFRQWLVVWHHQPITWTNVDLPLARSNGIHLGVISHIISQPSITHDQIENCIFKFPTKSPRGKWVKTDEMRSCTWDDVSSEGTAFETQPPRRCKSIHRESYKVYLSNVWISVSIIMKRLCPQILKLFAKDAFDGLSLCIWNR